MIAHYPLLFFSNVPLLSWPWATTLRIGKVFHTNLCLELGEKNGEPRSKTSHAAAPARARGPIVISFAFVLPKVAVVALPHVSKPVLKKRPMSFRS